MPFFNGQFLKCDILPISNDPMFIVLVYEKICTGSERGRDSYTECAQRDSTLYKPTELLLQDTLL